MSKVPDQTDNVSDDGLSDSDSEGGDANPGLKKKFTNDQLEHMESKLAAFKACPPNEQREFAIDVAEHMLSLIDKELERRGRKKLRAKDRKIATKNVVKWFRSRTRKRKHIPDWEHKWTARQAFYKRNKDKVKATQAELYEEWTGKHVDAQDVGDVGIDLAAEEDLDEEPDRVTTATPFHFFQRALSLEISKLKKKEPGGMQPYEELADQWAHNGPGREEQKRLAELQGAATVREFHKTMFRQMGMRMVTLIAWEDPEDSLFVSFVDSGVEVGGRSFKKEFRSQLRNSRLMPLWMKFARSEMVSDNPDEPPVTLRDRGKPLITFESDTEGNPILHNPNVLPDGITAEFQYLIDLFRAYVTAVYAIAADTRVEVTHPPWTALMRDIREYIDEEYLPDNLVPYFCDPSSLRKKWTKAILKHWHSRQERGLIPLAFIKIVDKSSDSDTKMAEGKQSGAAKGKKQPGKGKVPDKEGATDKGKGTDNGSATDKGNKTDKGQRADEDDRSDNGSATDKGNKTDKGQRADKDDRSDNGGATDKGNKTDKGQRADKDERSDNGVETDEDQGADKDNRSDNGIARDDQGLEGGATDKGDGADADDVTDKRRHRPKAPKGKSNEIKSGKKRKLEEMMGGNSDTERGNATDKDNQADAPPPNPNLPHDKTGSKRRNQSGSGGKGVQGGGSRITANTRKGGQPQTGRQSGPPEKTKGATKAGPKPRPKPKAIATTQSKRTRDETEDIFDLSKRRKTHTGVIEASQDPPVRRRREEELNEDLKGWGAVDSGRRKRVPPRRLLDV